MNIVVEFMLLLALLSYLRITDSVSIFAVISAFIITKIILSFIITMFKATMDSILKDINKQER